MDDAQKPNAPLNDTEQEKEKKQLTKRPQRMRKRTPKSTTEMEARELQNKLQLKLEKEKNGTAGLSQSDIMFNEYNNTLMQARISPVPPPGPGIPLAPISLFQPETVSQNIPGLPELSGLPKTPPTYTSPVSPPAAPLRPKVKRINRRPRIEPPVNTDLSTMFSDSEAESDMGETLKLGIYIVDDTQRGGNRKPKRVSFNDPRDQGNGQVQVQSNEDVQKAQKLKMELEKVSHEIDKINQESTSTKDKVLLSEFDIHTKADILLKLKSAGMTDYSKVLNWVTNLLKIPINKYKPMVISEPSTELFLSNRQKTLDSAVYGLTDVKEQILDFLAQIIRVSKSKETGPETPQRSGVSRGHILALQGPPGVGKTRLVRSGISEALDRYFGVINFGGLKDAALLDGHDMTYVGAKYGRIAQILMNAKYMNPVIYLDEVDKIPEQHTDEISGILTHLLDEEQNSEFFDHYFQGIPLDLSRVIFIISFNDIQKVNHIVSDRMKIIKIQPPSVKQKVIIGRDYILPELIQKTGLSPADIQISDEDLSYIIETKTIKEEGVRKFKKNLETIIQHINTLDLINSSLSPISPSPKLVLSYRKGILQNATVPITVTKEIIDILLDSPDVSNLSYFS